MFVTRSECFILSSKVFEIRPILINSQNVLFSAHTFQAGAEFFVLVGAIRRWAIRNTSSTPRYWGISLCSKRALHTSIVYCCSTVCACDVYMQGPERSSASQAATLPLALRLPAWANDETVEQMDADGCTRCGFVSVAFSLVLHLGMCMYPSHKKKFTAPPLCEEGCPAKLGAVQGVDVTKHICL